MKFLLLESEWKKPQGNSAEKPSNFIILSKIFNETDFQNFEKRFRANFFNSIIGFRPLHLVGTMNKAGMANLAIFSSVFHLGSNPAYFGMMVRPSEDTPRHTLTNILETGFFTLNHLNESFYKKAHQTSAKYDEGVSEFEACDIESEFLADFKAPFVKESKVKMGLAFVEKHEMEFNKTTLVVGKVICASVPESHIATDGFVDIAKAGTLAGIGIDGYATVDYFTRLSYAKVDKPIAVIHP